MQISEFGQYIKDIRERKNMTLNQVALNSEISAAQLSRIETGKRGTPKPTTIEKIAEALKVDYQTLMKVAGYIEDDSESGFKKEIVSHIAFTNFFINYVKERGLDPKRLAEVMRVHETSFSDFLEGCEFLDIERANDLAEYLKLPLDQIVTMNKDLALRVLQKYSEQVNDITFLTMQQLGEKYDLEGLTKEEINEMMLYTKARRNIAAHND